MCAGFDLDEIGHAERQDGCQDDVADGDQAEPGPCEVPGHGCVAVAGDSKVPHAVAMEMMIRGPGHGMGPANTNLHHPFDCGPHDAPAFLFLLTLLCLAPRHVRWDVTRHHGRPCGVRVDFLIADVNVGANAAIWIQPNGTQQPYLEMGETVDSHPVRQCPSLVPKNATFHRRRAMGFV